MEARRDLKGNGNRDRSPSLWHYLRMNAKLAAFVVAGILLAAMTALGHHSFAGTYDLDQHKTIQGTVTTFVVRNPHSYLTIEVKNPDGKVQVWGVEWAGTTALRDS